MPRLLVVEDDDAVRVQLKYALQDHFQLDFAADRAEALARAAVAAPDVVLLDLGLPPDPDTPGEGLKALEELSGVLPQAKIVVLTGHSDRQHALRAVAGGAFDFHPKPVDLDTLVVVLRRAAYLAQLERESQLTGDTLDSGVQFEELLGVSPAMRQIFTVIQRVARTDATVLIEGESGTGKELIARAIHQRSPRRTHPFVAINCGAIPDTLLESELFGHEKGAFTGAHVQRKGRLELADGGTLFLDEIGELSPMLQVKLLRVLQERAIERLGGRTLISLDLRVIAATNRNLRTQLEQGLFRQDLYYRLSVVTLQVPPLRQRPEDIVLLAHTFLRRLAAQHRRRVRLSPDALRALTAYGWPGNVRELENRIARAVIMSRGREITPQDLELEAPVVPSTPPLREARAQAERQALLDALTRHRGNISHAARDLRVSRPTLHALLEKHQLDARSFK
jgi:two-component system NtrC family response regulator